MSRSMSDAEKGLLAVAVAIEGTYVKPETVIAAGRLVERGAAYCESDYDGLLIMPTEAGKRLAVKHKLVALATDSWGRSCYERTDVGLALSKAA